MIRRKFLTGATIAIASTAGCVGSSTEPAADNSDSASAASVNPPDQEATLTPDGEIVQTFDLPDEGNGDATAQITALVQLRPAGYDKEVYGSGRLKIRNQTSETVIYEDESSPSYRPGDSRLIEAVDTGDVWGDTIEIRFDAVRSNNLEWRFSYGGTVTS